MQNSSATDGKGRKGQRGERGGTIVWVPEDPRQSSSQNGSPVKTGLQILGICYGDFRGGQIWDKNLYIEMLIIIIDKKSEISSILKPVLS